MDRNTFELTSMITKALNGIEKKIEILSAYNERYSELLDNALNSLTEVNKITAEAMEELTKVIKNERQQQEVLNSEKIIDRNYKVDR